MTEPPLRVSAHAKLNLGLAVLGRRADGFHDIDTLFVRVGLHDDLYLKRSRGVTGELIGMAEGAAFQELAMDEDNLALRAARSYLSAAGQPGGVEIGLVKRIPIAAGLGGGSADAAAVLLGLAWLYPRGLDLAPLALELGSDVQFFLSGHPAARGRGRGDLLEPVYLPRLHVVLANPGVAVSAAEAYRLNSSFSPEGISVEGLAVRLARGEEPGYRNDLQEAVVRARPVVGEVLSVLAGAGLEGVAMSGSGATCFGLADSARAASDALRRLRAARPEWWLWAGEAGG